MEKYKVFYYNGKELCAYTLRGTFESEEEATKELLAKENGIDDGLSGAEIKKALIEKFELQELRIWKQCKN